jgi:SAM-dependent methyltransferase
VRPLRRRPPARASPPAPSPADRFRRTDSYRARREWLRYEGTGQRDLYRELRERFLLRHSVASGWVLDLGSGPGRFLPFAGGEGSRRVALDLSREMLRAIPDSWMASGAPGASPHRVQGDALRPPFHRGQWEEVVALGNPLGFAGKDAGRLLEVAEDLVAPGGLLLLEIAPSSGEHSRYLARLPASSLARLLYAPRQAVLRRLDREGFRSEPARRAPGDSFRRFTVREIHERWGRSGWEALETSAVAPVLGSDPERIAAVRADARAWPRLIELEEEVGRRPERWKGAAAVLLAGRHLPSKHTVK